MADLEHTARQYKALERRRKVTRAVDLLTLVFLYALGGLSQRVTAAVAAALHIVAMEGTAVRERVRHCAAWLEYLLLQVLNQRCPPPVMTALGRTLSLVDGSSLSRLGSRSTDWRLHLRLDPVAGRFTEMSLSDVHGAESLSRFAVRPGDLLVGDRFFAKAQGLARVVDAGGDFIVRTGWRALALRQSDGTPVDLVARLQTIDHNRPVEHAVEIAVGRHDARRLPARLIVVRLPEPAASQAITRAERKARRKQDRIRPETRLAAPFLMLVTSLPATPYRAELVLSLYRLRWQVELAIKRLKGLLKVDEIPAFDPDVVRSWLLAHLIAALLIEEIAAPAAAFSPGARPGGASAHVAVAPPAVRADTGVA